MHRTFKVLGIVFSLIGIVLLFVAFLIYQSRTDFIKNSIFTKGKVIAVVEGSSSFDSESGQNSFSYFPVVEFIDSSGDTIRFRSNTGRNPPEFKVGESANIRFLAATPEKAKIDSFASMWIFPVIFASIGLPFFLLGVIFSLIPFLNKRKEIWLLEHGKIVLAEIDRIDLNRSVRINGNYPWVIYAQMMDAATNRIHTFHSKNIWYNPKKYIHTRSVQVRVHPDNPRKYVMDISFLPEEN